MAKRRATLTPDQATCRRSSRTTAIAGDARYNMAYHPADKVLRPANARKALGLPHDESSDSDKENLSQVGTDEDEEKNQKSEAVLSKRFKRPLYSKPKPDPGAVRRSKRSEARKPVLYNAKVHPIDVHYRNSHHNPADDEASQPVEPEESDVVADQISGDDAKPSDEDESQVGDDIQKDAESNDSETESESETELEPKPEPDRPLANIDNEYEHEAMDRHPDPSKMFQTLSAINTPTSEPSSNLVRMATSSKKQSTTTTSEADDMSEDSDPDEIPSQIHNSNSKVVGWRGADSHAAMSKSDPRLLGFRTVDDDSILDEHADTIEAVSQFLNADNTHPPRGSVEY